MVILSAPHFILSSIDKAEKKALTNSNAMAHLMDSEPMQQQQTSSLYPKLPESTDKPANIPSGDMSKPGTGSMFQFGTPSTNQPSFGGAASSSLFGSATQQEKVCNFV